MSSADVPQRDGLRTGPYHERQACICGACPFANLDHAADAATGMLEPRYEFAQHLAWIIAVSKDDGGDIGMRVERHNFILSLHRTTVTRTSLYSSEYRT